MSSKEKKANFPQVTVREDKISGRGVQTHEAKALGRLLGCMGQKAHYYSSTPASALGHLFQSRAAAIRGREDIMAFPSQRLWEAITGTWYSNSY